MDSIWLPLWISLRVALLATVLAYPAGLLLACLAGHPRLRQRAPLTALGLDAAILLPLLLPGPVLAYYFLVAFNRSGPLGRLVEGATGSPLLFTETAAVLAAALHVLPLVALLALRTLRQINPLYAKLAQSLGASEWRIFWRVTLPLAAQPLAAIGLIAFARAMAEFGVTLMVAGTVTGSGSTLPVALFEALRAGNALVSLTLAVTASVFAVLFLLTALRIPARQGIGVSETGLVCPREGWNG